MPVHNARGVAIHLVGHRGYVVGTLHVGVGVGNDELLALLEVEQSLAQFLQRGKVGAQRAAVQVDALHVVVVLGHLDGSQQVVESLRLHLVFAHEGGKGILGAAFLNGAVERDVEHAVVLECGFLTARGSHRNHHHEAAYKSKYPQTQYAGDGGQHVLQKVFHKMQWC